MGQSQSVYVNEKMSHVEMLSKLSGPVYLGENNRSNSLNVILKNAEILKQLAGPLYVKENSKHAFVEVMKTVDTTKKAPQGPV